MSRWPDGRHAAVSLTFDNLGEAAEIELGLRGADDVGDHYSVTVALPVVLEELAAAALPATFFVEGRNGDDYPQALRNIAAAGHEVAFHAYSHEDWGRLTAAQEAANLDRGLAALRALGLDVTGFRPPGGLIGPTTAALLDERGVRYCSPAGARPGRAGVVLLPFAWPAVDVFHVLPQFGALRAHLTGADEPGGPDAVRTAMLAAIDAAVASRGHAALVFHTWMAEHERDVLREVLEQIRARAASGDLWAARCDSVAAWIAEHPEDFADPPQLDRSSWQTPS
jgi:peptidoglycan/xylan/chitin deacetylase (PgdA/CDA1 family)